MYLELDSGGQPVERSPYPFKTPKPIRGKVGKITELSESEDNNARIEIEDDNSQVETEDDDFQTPKALKKVAQTLASDDNFVDNDEVDYALESDQQSDIPPKEKLSPKGSNGSNRIRVDLAKVQKTKIKRAFRDEWL
jgi:hypothetical protein